MGFIDQIMGAMGMEAAQTVTEEPTSNADPQRTEETKTDEVKEKAEKIQDLDDGTDQGEGASSEEKTYSRDELNDILNEKRKEWKKELFKANMKDQINNRLTEEGIPVKAAELIQYTDEAGTLKSLETVISTIKELVSDGITERLRGKTPEGLGKSASTGFWGKPENDFDGVNKVNVYSVETVPLNDYDINAKSNRYGTPVELGNDVQTLELTQDKSFTFSIDRKNATDTMMAMSAAKALARELKEVVTPTIDRYRIAKYTAEALAAHTKEETLTTETAYSAFLEGSMVLFDAKVPTEGRIAFVTSAYYKAIKLDKNFVSSGDKGQEIAVTGAVGTIDKTTIIVAPADYFVKGTNFIICHPMAMTSPVKLADYKIHENPQGINGWLVEGRIYYDAFVLNNKKAAIYLSKQAAK